MNTLTYDNLYHLFFRCRKTPAEIAVILGGAESEVVSALAPISQRRDLDYLFDVYFDLHPRR